MKKVERSEVLDLGAYEGIRDRFRARIIEEKKNRRVTLGDHMTFIFENHDTVLFQIQEMLRTERISSERGVAHEVETYNDLVPDEGELSATLMIEYEDREERHRMLGELAGVGEHIRLRVGDRTATAVLRPLPGEEPDRLPAVNYLHIPIGREAAALLRDDSVEAVLEIDHPSYRASTSLSRATRSSLADDLD